MALGYPQKDGFALDFGRLELDAAGKIYDRISNVSTSQPVEEGVIFGSKPRPIARTRGQMQIGDGTMEMEFEQACQFIADLGDGWQEKLFTLSLTYRNSDGTVKKIVCTGCRLLDCELDHEAGADGLPASFPFSFMEREIDGKKALLD